MTDQEKDVQEESQEQAVVESEETAETHDGEAYEWKEPPSFNITHKEGCVCEVKVVIPKANLTAMLDEVYEEMNDGVQVPGFRRGKAPRKLLEKRLGKYARSSAVERLADHAGRLLMEQNKLTPINQAKIEGLEDAEHIPEDQDIAYTLTFETPGKCTLGEYEGVEIKKPVYDVPESEVDSTIESMRTRYGRFEPLEEGVAENGDQVIIDFHGKVNGEDFEGNRAENYPYILGSQRFVPEMEAAMAGKKAGETATAEFAFPEDYRSKDIAGKMAVFEIKINEIKRRVLPELDDEFAKRLGHDTVEELRDSIRKRIGENANEQVREYMRGQARQKLIECSTFELPQSQVQHFIDSEYRSMEQRLMQQHVPAEDIEQHREEMKKAAEEQGMMMIKSMYAVRALAEKEGIKATDADFDEYANTMSSGYYQNPELMKEYLLSDDMRSLTEYNIIESKVLDRIVEKATIVEEAVSDDEKAEDDKKDEEKSDA